MTSIQRAVVFSCAFGVVVSGLAQADFERVQGFPGADPAAYGIAVQALPSGLFLVWDGNSLYRQTLVGGEDFDVIASGYEGDPSFMALSPDGHTVLLGGGYMRPLMLFDINSPVDYTPDAVLSNSISHYWGVFLTEALIDKGTDDYTTDELGIVDVTEEVPGDESVFTLRTYADPEQTALLGEGAYSPADYVPMLLRGVAILFALMLLGLARGVTKARVDG